MQQKGCLPVGMVEVLTDGAFKSHPIHSIPIG